MRFLNKFIDATVLGPAVDTDRVTSLAHDTTTHHFASVCIPPYFVSEIKTSFPDISVGTVIGFPQGIASVHSKVREVTDAINSGADELDIVVNLTAIANDNLSYLDEEMQALMAVKGEKIYKIILESALWEDGQLARIVEFYSQYDIDFLKTSTGFNTSGATTSAVQIMLDHKSEGIQIKASGGIKTAEDAQTYIDMGVTRIGTSSPLKLIEPNT